MIKFKDLYVSLASDQDVDEKFGRPPVLPIVKTTTNCLGGSIHHLKDYLVRALAIAVDLENQATENPQTVAEVEMLEEKLKGALDELRARKAELERDAA